MYWLVKPMDVTSNFEQTTEKLKKKLLHKLLNDGVSSEDVRRYIAIFFLMEVWSIIPKDSSTS